MQQLLQPVSFERRPLWLRVLALVCILMVTIMGTAQLVHSHTEFSKQHSQNHGNTSSNDSCQLCVAMHYAFDVPQHFAPEPMVRIQRLDSVAAEAERLFRWRFEMASRPPPAQDAV